MVSRKIRAFLLVVAVIAIATLPVLLVAEEWKPTQAYRKMVNRIEALGKIQRLSSQKKLQRLEELDKTAREIEQKWRQTDVEVYARLTYEVCATMGSLDFGTHKNHYLAQSFAMRALEKADDIPLELECKLLGYVQDRMDVTGKPLKGEAWAVLRKKQAKLWLRACQRIEKTIDNNWDPNDMPSLNVVPPATTGLPPGVAPSAIKDPKLRAEYEAAIEANRKKAGDYSEQHRVRDLKKYFIPMAERFIIGAYIELPMAELEGLLEQNISDPNKRASILKAVEKKELPKIELPTTQPLEAKPTTRPSETPKQSNNVPVKI